MPSRSPLAAALAIVVALGAAGVAGCRTGRSVALALETMVTPPRKVKNKLRDPRRPEARLAVLWVGHATVLIQIDDRFILTDPVFTRSVGQVSSRSVEPGIDVDALPPIDLALVSHMHFDHLSQGSLEMLEPKIRRLLVPEGGTVYVPDYRFDVRELARWQHWDDDTGVRVTAVPVDHNGWRYALDSAWMTESFTGYVVSYHGIHVYFGGDTAYGAHFAATARRFPRLDLAILPIAPIEPRAFMRRTHVDGREAVQAFLDLGADAMVPIHYDTFQNSTDEPGDAERLLRRVVDERGIAKEKVHVLEVGEQRVLLTRASAADPP